MIEKSNRNPLIHSISNWKSRTFADPEAVSLFMVIVLGLLLLEFFGKILMPILISIIIAYLLNSVVKQLKRWHCPHLVAVIIVYILFLGLFIYALVGLLPVLWRELSNLVTALPGSFAKAQAWMDQVVQNHPVLLSESQLLRVMTFFKDQSPKVGQLALGVTVRVIPSLAESILYLILVPLLVFFFLKDSRIIVRWISTFLPRKRTLVKQVWLDVQNKIGCYVRGRVIEIFIVGIASAIVFYLLGLQYAVLLGALVGVSVLVPYIGAVAVTIPVVVVALMEWGLGAQFWYLMMAYAIIIAIDGNLLFPLLFAGTMKLHPVVIIGSVLVFGGLWGFWGVFFAIPLATLANAILTAWPRSQFSA